MQLSSEAKVILYCVFTLCEGKVAQRKRCERAPKKTKLLLTNRRRREIHPFILSNQKLQSFFIPIKKYIFNHEWLKLNMMQELRLKGALTPAFSVSLYSEKTSLYRNGSLLLEITLLWTRNYSINHFACV